MTDQLLLFPNISETTKLRTTLPKGFTKLAISGTLEGIQDHINAYFFCLANRPKVLIPIPNYEGFYYVANFFDGITANVNITRTGFVVIQTTKRFYFGSVSN